MLSIKSTLSPYATFAAEFKRRDKDMHQAVYRAAYDGVVLVFARNRGSRSGESRCPRWCHHPSCCRQGGRGDSRPSPAQLMARSSTCFCPSLPGRHVPPEPSGQRDLRIYRDRGRELIRNAQEYAWCKSYELARLLGADL